MPDGLRVFVVPHSHWDREWYQPFEQFRLRLGRFLDSLIDLMTAEPEFAHFTLDGQTIPVEDYAEIRPERLDELLALVRAGRIAVGPWYVLPDEFLTSAEAAVRNLILGHQLAARWGRPMKVGYIPDTFGHIAQMPQLLRGFGIDTALLWRGVGGELRRTKFRWRGLDGSEVLAEFMPNGYANAALLPADPERLAARVAIVDSYLVPAATSRNLLYMNGWDHLSAQPDLPAVVRTLRELTGREVAIATIEQFLVATRDELGPERPGVPAHVGELRSPQRSQLLPGVLSTRTYLKQANFQAQTLLERWVEPAAATAALLLGQRYPRGELWQAWRYLLQNHPHDSICGCSVDEVHDEMVTRFRKCRGIGEPVAAAGLRAVAAAVDGSQLPGPADAPVVAIFNPLGQPRSDAAVGTAVVQRTLIRRPVPRTAPEAQGLYTAPPRLVEPPLPAVTALALVDAAGQHHPAQVLGVERAVELETGEQHLPVNWLVDRVRFASVAADVPPLGYRAYRVALGEAAPAGGVRASGGAAGGVTLENAYLRVAAAPDGTLTLTDLRSGAVYPGCHRLSDTGERGDEYTYCPPAEDREVGLAGVTLALAESGPVRATLVVAGRLELPVGLSADRARRAAETVACAVRTTATLHAGVPRLDFRTEVENLARDHRLRVAFPVSFPTGLAVDHCWAETQWGVVRRSLELPADTAGWIEQPLLTAPQQGFVDVSDGRRGLALLNRGLPEYEVRPAPAGAEVYLTLLRCVGWLSRGDLSTRVGHAGPGLPTPGGQCLGAHTFEYALYPHAGDWQAGGVVAAAQGYAAGLRVVDVAAPAGALPPALGLVALEPAALTLSAVKLAEPTEAEVAGADRGDGCAHRRLIVRAYNASGAAIQGALRCWRRPAAAALVSLGEEEQALLALAPDGAVPLALGPWQVATVALTL